MTDTSAPTQADPITTEIIRNAFVSCAQDMNATLSIVWVHCDATTMHTYIRHRGAARDATKIAACLRTK